VDNGDHGNMIWQARVNGRPDPFFIGLDPDLYEIIRQKAVALKTSEEEIIRESIVGRTGA